MLRGVLAHRVSCDVAKHIEAFYRPARASDYTHTICIRALALCVPPYREWYQNAFCAATGLPNGCLHVVVLHTTDAAVRVCLAMGQFPLTCAHVLTWRTEEGGDAQRVCPRHRVCYDAQTGLAVHSSIPLRNGGTYVHVNIVPVSRMNPVERRNWRVLKCRIAAYANHMLDAHTRNKVPLSHIHL